MSQAEAAEPPSKDENPILTLEQIAENVRRASRLMKELSPTIAELAESINRAGESLRRLGGLASMPDRNRCGINATLRKDEEILPSDFVREDRYFVVKREDVKTTLSNAEKVSLNYLLGKIEIGRKKRGKEKRAYVVVADHWPMYEQVWAMVKEYADKQAKRAWEPLDDEAPACSKCDRAPFQYRLDEAQITYGCKCGHEWEAGQ